MKNTLKFKDYLKGKLDNKEFKEAYEEEKIYASIAVQIAKIRKKKRLTQNMLGKLLSSSQQNISRLEDIHNKGCSIETLIKISHALGKDLQIKLV